MQECAIQRLRYRLKSIGCTDIHINNFYSNECVFATFYYGDKHIRVHIPYRYINYYPFVHYEFYF